MFLTFAFIQIKIEKYQLLIIILQRVPEACVARYNMAVLNN